MSKIIIYGLILLFFYLIINHLFLTTKEGLESNSTTASDANGGCSASGCKTVATAKNEQAAQYTKTKMKNAKSTIESLMTEVSKLIKKEKTKQNENTDNIAKNADHVAKMKDALKPDN